VPDYRDVGQRFAHSLDALHHETEIAVSAENTVRTLLELENARLLPFAEIPSSPRLAPLAIGESVELGTCDHTRPDLPLESVELLVPVRSNGQTTHVLAIAPGLSRRALVSHEVSFIRSVAAQTGQRFDALRSERERVERLSREAVLLQQVAEAELRALRAQINPHFLFNSLNTVADLVITDPARAELMTLRLAQVFRHVLAHSARPVTSIREEIEFVRTYLFIEEARFGDRLRVEIDVAPEVAAEKVPSLILQPLVENALKHGLGPKIGPGHLRISAAARQDHVCLTVEDDGVGPGRGPRRAATGGVGLRNVAERLRTLYQDRAGVRLEPGLSGGSLVTILIPWHAHPVEA
jgi:two-component system, LytTR family, sensor kinase